MCTVEPELLGSTIDINKLDDYLGYLHSAYARQALFVTEFGAEANHDGPADELGSFDYQTNFFIYHLREMHKKSYINNQRIGIHYIRSMRRRR